MSKFAGPDIVKRFAKRQAERRNIESKWVDVETFVLPYRGNFYRDTVQELSIDLSNEQYRYDDTAVNAASNLSASIHGALTSFTSKWFDYKFTDKVLKDNEEANGWLQEATGIQYDEMVASNFDLEISETYIDLIGFGTSPLTVEAIEDEFGNYIGLDYRSVQLVDAYYDLDPWGRVMNFYRRLNWSAMEIVNKFGFDGVPDFIKEKAQDDTAGVEKIEVIFCIYKREPEKRDNGVPITSVLAPEKRPYAYVYVCKKTGDVLGEEGGYYEMPANVARWRKTNDSQWGNSPAMKTMSTIKTANELVRLQMLQLGKVVAPATLVEERALVTDLDLEENGLTVVRDINAVREMESKARFDVGELKLGQIQDQIRQGFMVDQLELKESPAMTATEVQVRFQLMQRLLGPTMGRLENDLFSPMLNRTFNILLRAGLFPDPPAVLLEGESAKFEISYVGPLPKAQRAQEVTNARGYLGDLQALSQIQIEGQQSVKSVTDNFDFDKAAREMADMGGVPRDWMVKEQTMKSERKRKQDQVQQAAQLQADRETAETGKAQAQAQSLRQVK
jgi:hypothetical protein